MFCPISDRAKSSSNVRGGLRDRLRKYGMSAYLYKVVSPAWQPSTYRRLLYLMPSGVLGMTFAAVYYALVRVGFAPVIAWACVLALVGTVSLNKSLRNADRRWTNRMLGTMVPPPTRMRTRVEDTKPPLHRLFGSSSHADWKAAGWVPFRLVFGSQSFLIALMVLLLPIYLFTMVMVDTQGYGAAEVLTSAGWVVAVIVPGFVLLWILACLHTNLVASLHAEMAPELLGPPIKAQTSASRRRIHELLLRDQFVRGLHNSVGRRLSGVVAQAGAAQQVFDADPQFVRHALAKIEKDSSVALKELSRTVRELRDGGIPRSTRSGLEFFNVTIDEMRNSGLPLSVRMSGDFDGLPEYLSREIHDVVQEGCTNVLKHAGLVPTSVRVSVDDKIVGAVVVNAAPLAELPIGDHTGGFGLEDIKERAAILGGTFRAKHTADGGFRLEVSLPLDQATG